MSKNSKPDWDKVADKFIPYLIGGCILGEFIRFLYN